MLLKLIKRKNSKGFSLIELIIVIVIIGILAAVVIPNMLGTTMQAHTATVDAMEGALKSAVELAHTSFLIGGATYYPHPTPGLEDHDDDASTDPTTLIDFLLKSYDDKWTVAPITYNFGSDKQDGGIQAGGPNVEAVKFIYDAGSTNEQRIYYTATTTAGVVEEFADRKSNNKFWFARESQEINAVGDNSGESAAPAAGGDGGDGGGDSDLRLKTDIVLTGHSPSGIPEYSFRYISDPSGTIFHGTMAQDLLKTHPKAVVTGDNGFYKVKYSLIDVDFYELRP